MISFSTERLEMASCGECRERSRQEARCERDSSEERAAAVGKTESGADVTGGGAVPAARLGPPDVLLVAELGRGQVDEPVELQPDVGVEGLLNRFCGGSEDVSALLLPQAASSSGYLQAVVVKSKNQAGNAPMRDKLIQCACTYQEGEVQYAHRSGTASIGYRCS